MKKLIIIFLMIMQITSTFSLELSLDNKKEKHKELNVETKQDFIKGLSALTAAGIFGYLSYECHILHYSPKLLSPADERNTETYIPQNLNFIDKILIQLSEKIKYPLSRRLNYYLTGDNYNENFIYRNIGIIFNAIAAFECVQYGTSKIYLAILSKSPLIKHKLSLIKSYINKIKIVR